MDDLDGDGLFSLYFGIGLILFSTVGVFVGMVAAMISAIVIERLSRSSYDYDALQVLPWTLSGCFIGFSIALLTALGLIHCIDSSQTCILSIPFELADLAVRLIGIVPSLSAIIGGAVYWRRYQ
ncbi:MAG: hypothetical protein KME15_14135 [Drouetiella hepatica Uher 2000/2452]|jgi:hypothetical protein|uniref:Uncharacterized protein n=1 Tax=Drouetiella hepatica Uher 2000/2452 TaxID=904376 RepID=A0A951UMX0_9CYAN|nr:hypothetical protein [Drouetiella hepatica Uher 2000/2452]